MPQAQVRHRARPTLEEVELRTGQRAVIRHVGADDRRALVRFMEHLSAESRYLRFFSATCDVTAAAAWAADADGRDHLGLLALDSGGEVIGHAACCRLYGPRAEVAVEVAEDHRHEGLATILIIRLAREAERAGVDRLIAEVLPQNREMLAVFHDGFAAGIHVADGQVHVEFPTCAWHDVDTRLGAPQPHS